jgi:hypothetical protein
MAKINLYKFVNPGGTRSSPGSATIAGKSYAIKQGSGDRTLVLATNRIGISLNQQTKILSSIKTSIDAGTKATVSNARVMQRTLEDIKKEDRIAKRNRLRADAAARREALLAASRARLGAKLNKKPTGGSSDEVDIPVPKPIRGFMDFIGSLLKNAVILLALRWLSNKENATKTVKVLTTVFKVLKNILNWIGDRAIDVLEGFSTMFGDDKTFWDRFKGFMQFMAGAFGVFLGARYLLNPLKIIGDIRLAVKALALIPKALSAAVGLSKKIIIGTRAILMGFGMGAKAATATMVLGGAALTFGLLEGVATRPAGDGTLLGNMDSEGRFLGDEGYDASTRGQPSLETLIAKGMVDLAKEEGYTPPGGFGGTPNITINQPPASGGRNSQQVLNLIAGVESGSYNSVNGTAGPKKVTELTINEIVQMKHIDPTKPGSGAAGRYQHMPRFLLARAKASGFDGNTKFTNQVQDKITTDQLNRDHGMQRWISGEMSTEDFAAKLAPTWRGLPQGPGRSGGPDVTYQDQYASGNKAHKTWEEVLKILNMGQQRMNSGGVVQPMFLGGIVKGIGKAVSGVGKAVSGVFKGGFGNFLGKALPIAASFIPGIGPIASAAIGAAGGLLSGGGIGGAISGALGGLGGIGGIGDMIGGSFGSFLQGPIGSMLGDVGMNMLSGALNPQQAMGSILAQGGEMIMGPGIQQMFGGTMDLLNVAGKGLGASDFLKKAGGGLLDFAIGKIKGARGGPDDKAFGVPGGSGVLNINAVKILSGLLNAQKVQQNSAAIQSLQGATENLTDKLVRTTGDVIAGTLVEKGNLAELPIKVVPEAMAEILPMIQNAIISTSQQAVAQASSAMQQQPQKAPSTASGGGINGLVAGGMKAIAGQVLDKGIGIK